MKNNNNNQIKTKKIKQVQIGIVLSCSAFFLLAFVVDNVHAEFINCPEGVDVNKYPICKFEQEWNASEEFNSLVVEKVGERADQINEMAKNTDTKMKGEIGYVDPDMREEMKVAHLLAEFSNARDQVKAENPGLYEKSQSIKDTIYKAIGQ